MKHLTKAERHEAIRERAREAIRDLYHNATPHYPRLPDEESEAFTAWFGDVASYEIEYINDGGAYGPDYRRTLLHEANAGKYKSPAAQAYYVRWKMRSMREDRARYAAWERTRELFGKLYTWGCGGRTLAPENLVKGRGGSSFALIEDHFDERPIAEAVEAIKVLESFNAYVSSWCESVPEMWHDNCAEALDESAVKSNN